MQQTGTYAEMAFCVKLISLFGSLNKVVIITTAEHRQIYEEIPTVCSVVVEESLMQLTAIEQRELIESFHADSFVSLSHNETIADLVYNCRIPLRINAATDCYYSHLFNQMVLVDSSKRQALIMDLLGFDQLPERQAIKFASLILLPLKSLLVAFFNAAFVSKLVRSAATLDNCVLIMLKLSLKP